MPSPSRNNYQITVFDVVYHARMVATPALSITFSNILSIFFLNYLVIPYFNALNPKVLPK
ncbi:MAG: hypothetical protein KO464_07355 [Candidatus Methanofastidiosum sp.]|nr:hypothetical protein [Methanofastidiosum sp.]